MKVEIMDRAALTERGKLPFSEDAAVISITDSEKEDVQLFQLPKHILRLKFDDVSDEIFQTLLGRKPSVREGHLLAGRFYMLSNLQARQIAEFVLSRNQQGTLICQCEYGQSRSAAVAAAVMEFYHRNGSAVFADSRYSPNAYVYRKVLCALRTYQKATL